MKKITFLLTLMLTLFGVSANAQVAFEASDAPTSEGWAANTKWYKMTLKNFYVSLLDADAEGNLYANSSAVPYGEQALWCIVGDATNGYKIYNKRAGVNKVFGMSNMTQDGAARAQLVDASNTTFATNFSLPTKDDVDNVFYLKDNVSGKYANNRAPYFSNWTSDAAYGDGGSQIRFYAVEDVDADIAHEITSVRATLQSAITTANTVIGDGLGYYSASNISAAQTVYDNANATADDVRTAIAALQPNQPKVGVIYRIVSAYAGFENTQHVKKGVYANGTSIWWGNVDTSNPYQYWFFEPTTGGFYLKNAAAHTYAYTANQLQATPSRVVTIAWPINSNGEPVANLRTGTDSPFHANNHGSGAGVSSALVGYGTFGSETSGASAWYIVPATVEEVNTITSDAISNQYPTTTKRQVGLYSTEDVEAFKHECDPFATVSTFDAAVEAFNGLDVPQPQVITFSADKYYRFVNVGTSTTDNENTLGTKDGKAFCSTGNNSNIDFVWQVLPSTTANRYYLKHANTGTYLQPVQNGQTAKTALGEATSNYELRNTETGVFKLYNTSNYPAQVETNSSNTNYLNGWDSDNAKWNIYEVNAIEIPLNTVGSSTYASAYLPFDVNGVEGAEAYVGTLNTDKSALDMAKVEGVPANNGFVLVGTSEKATLTIGTATAVTDNSLMGTNTDITLGDDTRANYLVFGKNADVVGFYTPSASVAKIGANKAYLDATALTGAATIAMNFGGTTTAINTTNVNNANVNAPVFDLSGRRVVAPIKGGVYIQNGKKFIK